MKQVFCLDCRNYVDGKCKARTNYVKAGALGLFNYITTPEDKNKANDCADFKRKGERNFAIWGKAIFHLVQEKPEYITYAFAGLVVLGMIIALVPMIFQLFRAYGH